MSARSLSDIADEFSSAAKRAAATIAAMNDGGVVVHPVYPWPAPRARPEPQPRVEPVEIAPFLPVIMPAGWREKGLLPDGIRMAHPASGLSLIFSAAKELDGKRWLHLSLAHPERMPRWGELRDAKETWLGDRKALQILPSRDEYVNEHPYCLHLWACLDGDGLPNFSAPRGGTI